jgi:hypothetical protein
LTFCLSLVAAAVAAPMLRIIMAAAAALVAIGM